MIDKLNSLGCLMSLSPSLEQPSWLFQTTSCIISEKETSQRKENRKKKAPKIWYRKQKIVD